MYAHQWAAARRLHETAQRECTTTAGHPRMGGLCSDVRLAPCSWQSSTLQVVAKSMPTIRSAIVYLPTAMRCDTDGYLIAEV